MAIDVSIDWGTSVITVLSASLTLVQENPTEIRSMNINEFRLALKDLEDNYDGICYLKTHDHNTEVTLGGLTFARVVEILDPYTITFEDGQYAVDLVGANSNIADKTNVNQVSVRSNNSAGLISTPLIEFASFEGGVWWDPDNNTGTAEYGSLFPIGTRLTPARDLDDVKIIAEYRGLNVIYLIGDGTVNSGLDFGRYVFEGQTHVNNVAFISPAAGVQNAVFRNLTVSGTLDGGNELVNCEVNNLDYVNGHIHDCGLIGSINLSGSSDAVFVNCSTIDPYDPPVVNLGGSGQNLAMPNYCGLLTLHNLTGSNFVGVGLNGGQICLSSSITSGTIHISGVGALVDESGNDIWSGTWNGGVTVINTLVYPDAITKSVWDVELVPEHTASNTAGDFLYNVGAGASPSTIAAAVWDTVLAAHTASGTTGEALSDAGGGASPTTIAAAVWDASVIEHTASNSFGNQVVNNLLDFARWFVLKK